MQLAIVIFGIIIIILIIGLILVIYWLLKTITKMSELIKAENLTEAKIPEEEIAKDTNETTNLVDLYQLTDDEYKEISKNLQFN